MTIRYRGKNVNGSKIISKPAHQNLFPDGITNIVLTSNETDPKKDTVQFKNGREVCSTIEGISIKSSEMCHTYGIGWFDPKFIERRQRSFRESY